MQIGLFCVGYAITPSESQPEPNGGSVRFAMPSTDHGV